MTLKRLSAVALAISTALTLTACGSEAETAYGLANASNPLVQPSNTGNSNSNSNSNSNTNTSNADAADAIDNTSAGTGTNTGTTTNPAAPNTTGNSTSTSQNTAIVTETGTQTIATKLDPNLEVKSEDHTLNPSQARNSLISELSKAYDQKDAYGNSRFETVAGYKATLNNSTPKRRGDTFESTELGQGYRVLTLQETAKTNIDGKEYTGIREAQVKLYQGDYSMVLGTQTLSGQVSNGSDIKTIAQGELIVDRLKGTPTKLDKIAKQTGTFTYNGKAFSQGGDGTFTYTVDFIDESGHGKITGLSDKGTINLNQASIGSFTHQNYDSGDKPLSGHGIQGLAHFENGAKEGVYTLGFFGENAEEVAGFITEDGNKHTVGFGGKKQ